MLLFTFIMFFFNPQSLALRNEDINMSRDYFEHKDIKFVCYLSCETQFYDTQLARVLMKHGVRISVYKTLEHRNMNIKKVLQQWSVPIGVIINRQCNNTENILQMASKSMIFDSVHSWLVLLNLNVENNSSYENRFNIEFTFANLQLSLSTDIIVATNRGSYYELTDVFNFGQIQGNSLERTLFGYWSSKKGLLDILKGYKYYNRWDFHNLMFTAITVVLGSPKTFSPIITTETRNTVGVSAMTKISAKILDVIREQHNFRFNFTIADRWIGSPKLNATMSVTNAMYWRKQDISVTCLRIFPHWLEWMDPFFPPATYLETKFYYLIPESGVGDFEDRFLTPLSPSVWWCAVGAAIACGILLVAAAALESHPNPAFYGIFSVLAAACQQGRRLILLVLGLTSMLLYNYYTSSVVSWLLNAAAPTIATIDGLISSELELTFEDIGYTRSWIDGPGFYYYSGFKSVKEDELREKKIKNAKRTVPMLLPIEKGIELVRYGRYAYHTEPYTASQIIGPNFDDSELCKLGSLQMMPISPVYIVGQKNSPYREFFVWSLMRAMERGHTAAARRRVDSEGAVPACSGKVPRALALGQAAPAFAVLAVAVLGTLLILLGEIMCHRYQKKAKLSKINT